MARVAARLTTPFAYVGVLGGLQVLLLWRLELLVGPWIAGLATALWLALLMLLVLAPGRWRLKLAVATLLAIACAIVPTLVGIITRARVGVTIEHDGLLQIESAIDRLLAGQPIYGVDWSNTPMARLPWDLTPGGNPAIHHLAYYPLTILVGVPFRLLTDALGLPFDYRLVLIAFGLIGLGAILTLPIAAERRLMVIAAIYLSPMITLYLWPGRTDIEFLSMLLVSLALLTRGHLTWAAVALGVAVAFKPLAWPAVPFFLLLLYLRWRAERRMREVLIGGAAVALFPLVTVAPFFLANPSGFWTDIVLFTAGGIKDVYPINGYGFAELLYRMGLIARRTDSFPFGIMQLAAMVPVLWFGARTVLRQPTLGRWMGAYAALLFVFTFVGRFFNDNYVGVVVAMFLLAPALGNRLLVAPPRQQAEQVAA
jgi:hypothetical protein